MYCISLILHCKCNNILVAVVILVCSLTETAGKWTSNEISAEWSFETVRKHINGTITIETVTSKTATTCATACTSITDIIVPSLFFSTDTGKCVCNSAIYENGEDTSQPEILYGTRQKFLKIELIDSRNTKRTVWPYEHDCSHLYKNMFHEDGVYVIYPPGGYLTDVWCNMDNGGWTVIQRRMDGSENFARDWNDYAKGFGNRAGEYWIGLENIHRLTNNGSELIIYMETYPGVTPSSMTAHYSNFKIGNMASKFVINISGFNGSCGDSLAYHNEQPFSTLDNDNDKYVSNCASVGSGGWWYKACHFSNLNGFYFKDGEYAYPENEGDGIHWYYCWSRRQSSKFSIMKIKTVN